MATVYQHDNNGYYLGTDEDYGGAMPQNCVSAAPTIQDGFVSRWDGEKWTQIEDHRGEKGYVAGQYTEIKSPGPLPEGWSTEPPPPPPDTRTPEEKRQAAYAAEADPIRQRIDGYRTEAEALRMEGDDEAAAECEAKAAALMRDFLAKKQDIRARYPDVGE